MFVIVQISQIQAVVRFPFVLRLSGGFRISFLRQSNLIQNLLKIFVQLIDMLFYVRF